MLYVLKTEVQMLIEEAEKKTPRSLYALLNFHFWALTLKAFQCLICIANFFFIFLLFHFQYRCHSI